MARNDVYLNINALSPADAVVTGQQDMTAATVPELVLGDTPTFNFYFTDNTNVWPSWAGNAAYTVTWALSDAVSGDFSPAATTGNATPITGGWSIVLPLNAYDLVGLLNTKRVSQPYPVTNLWQQIRVADPSGNEITRAMFWTPIRYRAISDTQNTESASPTGGREVTVDNVNVLTTPTAAQFYAANPVPTSALGSAANGELLIGNGTGFTKSTLTAGTGITVTNGSGSITIDASGAQETLTATVKNAESVAITKGQVVYLFGATGNMPSVKLAYNTSDATSAKTFGVVSDTSIAPNGTGTVTCVGVVDGLNLGAYSDGDTVYLGATAGTITTTKPYAPNHLVYVGIIERANSGNGELYVRVQNGYELDEIHDVQITTPPASGSLLIRDNTLSLWKAARLTAGTNIAVTNGDAAVTVGLTGTVAVANGGTGVTTSTGTGSVVLSTSPSLTTPSLGAASATSINGTTIPSSKTLVVTTDKLSALAATTSAELAGVISDETGTGALVFANTPTLVTPNIGAATGTSLTVTGNVTASDAILGTSGPSVKSTLSARAPRQGLVFNGTAGATVSVPAPGTGDYTRVFWINTNTIGAAKWLMAAASGPTLGVYITTTGNLAISDLSTGGYVSTGTIVAGKTYMVSLRRSGTSLYFGFNGIEESAVTDTRNYTVATSTYGSASGAAYFDGFISGLAYNRALSASEVVALYEAGAPAGADYGPSGSPAGTAITRTLTVGTWTGSVGGSTFTISTSSTGYISGGIVSYGSLPKCKFRVNYDLTINSGPGPTLSDGNVFSSARLTAGTGKTVELTNPNAGNQLLVTNDYAAGNYVLTINSVTVIGLLLAPDAAQAGGGLTWYDTSGNAANITLPASGVSWNVPTSGYLGGNWTTSGNLTVSGGTTTIIGSAPALALKRSSDNSFVGYIDATTTGTLRLFSGVGGSNALAASFPQNGNLLLGTTTDSANGKLQLATHTTSAGGIGFGTDTSFFRNATGRITLGRNDSTNAAYLRFAYNTSTTAVESGSIGAQNTVVYIDSLESGGSIQLRTNGTTTALTLDSSQNATFAGLIGIAGNTLRGVGRVYNSATGDAYGMEQVSGSQNTGNGSRAAVRFFSPSAQGSEIDFGYYSDASTYNTTARVNTTGITTIGVLNTQAGTASTPASASATGTAGTIQWDADYIYVCTAANTWKRVAIATW